MSTETPPTTPDADSKSEATPQAAAPSATAEPHACCHTVTAASPAVTIASPPHAHTRTPVATDAPNAASHACSKHKAGDALTSLVKELESPDPATRATAVVAMGRLADHAAAAPLIGALRDTDADVAREAATSLGVLGDASAVEPLIAVLQNADGYYHPVVRAAATFSLGQLHDLRAFEPLVEAISDPVAEASAEAIRSLATLADPRCIDALLTVIRNEHGFFLPTARRAAILALATLGGPQAECELRFVSTNQWEDAVVRQAAIDVRRTSSPTVAAD
jgi:HEAT repeat protein